jgi:toxin ParE1/3/4
MRSIEQFYRIRESPNRHAVIDDEVRRCMARKYPYGILYTIEQDYILILAVMNCSREPEYWKSRR